MRKGYTRSNVRALLFMALGSLLTLAALTLFEQVAPRIAAQAQRVAGQNRPAAASQAPPQPNTLYSTYEPIDGKGREEVSGAISGREGPGPE
jgi:hypothetical protein